MKDQQDNLSRDLQVLRYLDALDAGDLETVAAIWDDASRDSELEAALTDCESPLFAEADKGTFNLSNGAIQRAVPEKAKRSSARPSQWHWAVAVAGLAAACLVVIFAWQGRNVGVDVARTKSPERLPRVSLRPKIVSPDVTAWRESRRILDGAEARPFVWPLPESTVAASNSIPADLLN